MKVSVISKFKMLSVMVLSLGIVQPSLAAETYTYSKHPETGRFIQEMVDEHQFDPVELEKIFASAERKNSILKAISRPAEKSKPWHEYRQIFITDSRIKKGKVFYEKHKEDLLRAQKQYGVPAEMIVAIIGVETFYGANKGSFRVIDALSTLGFDYPKRSKFFRQQLKEFLLLTREEKSDPLSHKGSYAGAMGYGQFIPSSYRNFAVDFDGDGRRDIWDNPTDAIGSVANYFKEHGWQSGQPVIVATKTSGSKFKPLVNKKRKPYITVGELANVGVSPVDFIPSSEKVTFIELDGKAGKEYWIGQHNFFVITQYNHSRMYAKAVYELSQEI